MRDAAILAFGLVANATTTLNAHNHSANDTQVPPEAALLVPASLAEVTWLIGDWEGRDSRGKKAVERWLPPIGHTMVGTFVQTGRGPDGEVAIDWAEHMHLREEAGTLVLNVMTMQARQETHDPLPSRKPLLTIATCMVQFENLTIECSDPLKPGAGLTVTYGEDFMGDGTGVYVIQYKKAGDE